MSFLLQSISIILIVISFCVNAYSLYIGEGILPITNILHFISSLLFAYLYFQSKHKLSTELNTQKKPLQEKSLTKLALSNILDSLDIAIWARDKKLNITYLNNYYSKLVLNENTVIDQTGIEINKFSKQRAKRALDKNSSETEEHPIVVDGKKNLFQFVDKPVNDGLIGYAYDISKVDNINKQLQLFLASQLENLSNASVIFDSSRKLKFYNQAFLKLWEIDENFIKTSPEYELLIDKLYYNRKLPEQSNYKKFKEDQIKLFTNLRETLNDFYYLPNGKFLRVVIMPYSMGGLLFSFEDLTDRLLLESSYNALIAVQKTIFNELNEALCIIGEDGIVEFVNREFLSLWHLDNNLNGKKIHFVNLIDNYETSFSDRTTFENHRQYMISAFSKRINLEILIEQQNSRVINRAIKSLPGGYMLILDTVIDSDDNANKHKIMKSNFLANVSYELRSPLTSIIGYTELINRDYPKDISEKQHEYLNDIVSAAKKLENFIEDVINLTSAEAGQLKLHLTRFNVAKTLESVISDVKAHFNSTQISYVIDSDRTEPHYIIADEYLFKQIIFKILCNSVEYSYSGSTVSIHIEKDGDFCSINILDEGKGVPLEEQQFIFNKFYQASNTKTPGRSGTGLGLPIVKKFIELHRGTIDFTSTENIGSSFTCRLPYNTYQF
jgi:signal transduction histidine kinase